jgi:group I intron endonuclease
VHVVVYKATNKINGKAYVGQTVLSLRERMGDHRRKAFVHGSRSHFHAAIRKYGFDAFEWRTLERVLFREALNATERFWIKKLNTANPNHGYNNTNGGDSFEFTADVRRKIGEAGRGIKRSEAFKENLRKVVSGSGNPFYGKRHTEEAKEKNRKAHLGKKLTPEHIAKCIHLGERNARSKITVKIAREIKKDLASGLRCCVIQRRYGISKGIVQGIKHGITWRHVT